MKLTKHTFFSFLSLFVFLSAFSTGSFFSLSNSIKKFGHFSKHKELKQDGSPSSSLEELVFEETEDDSEPLNPCMTILPDFLTFNIFNIVPENNFSDIIISEKSQEPLFISLRVLRL